jgi:hypothetical protein
MEAPGPLTAARFSDAPPHAPRRARAFGRATSPRSHPRVHESEALRFPMSMCRPFPEPRRQFPEPRRHFPDISRQFTGPGRRFPWSRRRFLCTGGHVTRSRRLFPEPCRRFPGTRRLFPGTRRLIPTPGGLDPPTGRLSRGTRSLPPGICQNDRAAHPLHSSTRSPNPLSFRMAAYTLDPRCGASDCMHWMNRSDQAALMRSCHSSDPSGGCSEFARRVYAGVKRHAHGQILDPKSRFNFRPGFA